MLNLCDARDGLADLADESIDLIVTDPPYRTISGGNKYHNAPKGVLSANDGKMFKYNEIEPPHYMGEFFRVLRPKSHCYVMSNLKNLFLLYHSAMSAGFQLHNIVIWKKNTANPNRWYMQDKEYILFFRKGRAVSIRNMGTKSVIEYDNIVGNRSHPTEKPVGLMDILIRNSSDTGDIVLDPFMGSGATCLAAKESGRNYIGMEIDPEYYVTACKRLGVMP